MNALHRCLCASRAWQQWLERDLLPWALSGITLGDEVLEIGAGPGAVTELLLPRVRELTCVEIDRGLADALTRRMAGRDVQVRCEDARALSSPDAAFDTVICMMVLHHVAPAREQDRVLAEAARVLRPGGTFVMLESVPGFLLRALHVGDTLLLADPGTIDRRLTRAGFDAVRVAVRSHEFRVQARRAATAPVG